MWSDAARQAALAARRAKRRTALYTPGRDRERTMHVSRSEMARSLREMRGVGLRGSALIKSVTTLTPWGSNGKTTKVYTNVKGSHFVDQGLKGTVYRAPPKPARVSSSFHRNYYAAPVGGAPSWAAKTVKVTAAKRWRG